MAIQPIIVPINFQVDNADLETQIAQAQAKVLKAFNKSSGALTGTQAQSFGEVEHYLNNMVTPAQLGSIKGNNPQLASAIGSYNRFAVSGQSDDDRKNDQRDQRNAAREQLRTLQALTNQHRQATNTLSRGMAVGGAFAMGNTGPLQRAVMGWAMGSLSQVLATAILGSRGAPATGTPATGGAGTPSGGGAGTQAPAGTPTSMVTQVASATAQAITSQLAKQAITSSGAADAALTATPEAGGMLGGLASAVASSPGLLAAGAVTGAVALGAMGYNQGTAWTAALRRNQYNLEANVAGSGGGQYAENSVLNNSNRFITDQGTVSQVYNALGNEGVQGISQVSEDAANSLALSRITGMGIDEATSTTGTFAVQGGMSPQDIGSMYEAVVKGSKSLNISMTGLIDTMTSFAKATNGANLSVKGAQSVMALQGYLGTRINAGSAIAPLANAGGSQAYTLENILHMNSTQFEAMQVSSPATLAARYGQWLGGMAGTGSQADRTQRMQIINQGIGGYDTTQMSQTNQEKFFTAMSSATSLQQIEAAVNKFHVQMNQGSQKSADTFTNMGATVSGDVSSKADQIANKLQTEANRLLDKMAGNTQTMVDNSNIDTTVFPSMDQHLADILTSLGKGGITGPNGAAETAGVAIAAAIAKFLLTNSSTSSAGNGIGQLLGFLGDSTITPFVNAINDLTADVEGNSLIQDVSNILSGPGKATAGVLTTAGKAVGGAVDWFSGLFGGGPGTGSVIAGSLTDQVYHVPSGHAGGGVDSITGSMLGSFETASTAIPSPKGMTTEQWLRTLLAVSAHESDFQIGSTSGAGAMGIGQLMPDTVAKLVGAGGPFAGAKVVIDKSGAYKGAGTFNPYDPDQAAIGEAYWLTQKINGPGGGNVPLGIADYYGDGQTGPGSYSATIGQDAAGITVTIVDGTSGGVNASVTSTKAPGINHNRKPVASRSPNPRHVYNPPPTPTPPAKPRATPTPTPTPTPPKHHK